MFQAFLIKYGEIGVKGKNRYVFEDALVDRIKQVLENVEGSFVVTKEKGRIYVEAHGAFDYEESSGGSAESIRDCGYLPGRHRGTGRF